MENIENDILLNSLPGIGTATYDKLISYFGNSKNVLKANKKQLLQANVRPKVVEAILNGEYRNNIQKEILKLEKNKIIPISRENKYYPKLLKKIKNSPVILYLKGNETILNGECIGIVGSRNCSEYGEKVTEEFSFQLAKNNLNIVSGMALGIDKFAHNGALNAKGKTIAILGSGFDYIYPNENKELFYNILEQDGAIITEYLPYVRPFQSNFVARNRIISGMSKAVIVAEANENSGALITANFALKQSRPLFCIPSNITNLYNKGGNELLKKNAKAVTSVLDILEELKVDISPDFYIASKNLNIGEENQKRVAIEEEYLPILKEIQKGGCTAIELAKALKYSIAKTNGALTIMELKGLIEKLPGGKFVIAGKFNI